MKLPGLPDLGQVESLAETALKLAQRQAEALEQCAALLVEIRDQLNALPRMSKGPR